MFKLGLRLVIVFWAVMFTSIWTYAQTATGSISGNVTDSSGAVVPDTTVTITNEATGATRSLKANSEGLYSAPALEAGRYSVRSERSGFKSVQTEADVQPGSSTNVTIMLTVGETTEVVNVDASSATMNYENHTVSGVIERESIQNLPLNGRSFVQLASLQPGVQVVTQAQGVRNAPIGISILGGGGQYPLVTVDGLQINDFNDGNAGAGTAINFSQEVIEEFQLSSANFDLSTFTTIQGAVNMVTRTGGNQYHGSAYFFYRDRNIAAYPGLRKPANTTSNPYFARKNPGFFLGGPLVKGKLFFFGSYEYTAQVAAVSVTPDLPSIQGLAGVYRSPNNYNYTTIRFDYKTPARHTMFLRWTNDRNSGFGVTGNPAFQSNWLTNFNHSDQIAFGVTTTVNSNLVNDFRFGFRDWTNRDDNPTPDQCTGSCFGGPVAGLAPQGLPQLAMVGSSNFAAGNNGLSPQNRTSYNFEPQDIVQWQKGSHRLKFGADLDVYSEFFFYPICKAGCMSVYSLETAKSTLSGSVGGAANIATYAPQLASVTAISSTADLLNLPISYPTAGLVNGFEVGPGATPGPYHQQSEERDLRPRFFFQDYWKIKPNLTLNYGLAWAFESGLWPSDMPIPGIEGPLYGLPAQTQQRPTPTEKTNFSPAFGFNYSPGSSGGKTVIRGGAGIYYDTGNYVQKLHTIANIGPVGNGPISLPSTVFTNIFANIVQQGPGGALVPLAVGAPIPTAVFTNLTLGQFMQIYNQQYPAISARLTLPTPITNGPYQYSNVDLLKQASVLTNTTNPMPRSYQTSLGVQRELSHNLTIGADWVRRQVEHNSLNQVDLNHYGQFVNGKRTPAIPQCTAAQLFVLDQQCSTGSFATYLNQGRAVYEGLLVRANKRLSNNYQFNVAYAWQNLNSMTVVDLRNYRAGYGPTLAHHNLNISGIVSLPWRFQISANSSFITRTPVQVAVTNIDLTGSGAVSSSPLPGIPVRGLPSKTTLAAAVAAFNAKFAGTIAANGQKIPTFALPANYELGRPAISQDLRVTKAFTYHERYRLDLYGEMFNVLNIANLTGYGFNIGTAFGQPTGRAGQVFNSSGPRAAQFGGRFSF